MIQVPPLTAAAAGFFLADSAMLIGKMKLAGGIVSMKENRAA